MARFRAVITVDYDADPEHYDGRSIPEMARMDQELFEEDVQSVMDLVQDESYRVFLEILDD